MNLDFRSYLAAELEEQLLSCSFTTIRDMGDGMVVMLVSAKSDGSEMMVFFFFQVNKESPMGSFTFHRRIPSVRGHHPKCSTAFYIRRDQKRKLHSIALMTFEILSSPSLLHFASWPKVLKGSEKYEDPLLLRPVAPVIGTILTSSQHLHENKWIALRASRTVTKSGRGPMQYGWMWIGKGLG